MKTIKEMEAEIKEITTHSVEAVAISEIEELFGCKVEIVNEELVNEEIIKSLQRAARARDLKL